MKRIDTFSFNNEFDILECRLTEMDSAVDYWVIVEADVTHGGNTPKPFHLQDHMDRFAPWADRIVNVHATGLPTIPDAWSRELAQREWVWEGLRRLDAGPEDIVLHGDVDEIPTVLAASLVRPRGIVRFEQKLYCFAVDWQHPVPWYGTVAAYAADIDTFAMLRNARMYAPNILPAAGWHLSWMGGREAAEQKLDSFCHPEIADMGWRERLDECYQTGLHVDGSKLIPVVVDGSWPVWIRDGHAPDSWYRP